jgi:hypothetical protein
VAGDMMQLYLLCPTCADDLCGFGFRDGFRAFVCYTCGTEEALRAPNTPLLECAGCERQMLDKGDYLCPRCRGVEWAAVEVKREIRRQLKRG